jgi:hypothetical protein
MRQEINAIALGLKLNEPNISSAYKILILGVIYGRLSSQKEPRNKTIKKLLIVCQVDMLDSSGRRKYPERK